MNKVDLDIQLICNMDDAYLRDNPEVKDYVRPLHINEAKLLFGRTLSRQERRDPRFIARISDYVMVVVRSENGICLKGIARRGNSDSANGIIEDFFKRSVSA
ncbi:hypothetical protein [Deinococcus sp. Leaf326]|uniref:hypothetical protein n=1 Tax=Deinococcus sp. Leaf326 TaxID=1736338 RepID=UPI0012E2091D|nr:hypothetical protein [Deinococcus sp. Leaf326]